MESTDWLLFLIAVLLATGIGVFIWYVRRREKEMEMMQTALYVIANRHQYFQTHDPIPVTLDPSVNKAIKRFQQTAVDIQGLIELAARWMVSQMPPETIEGMGAPEEWVKAPTVKNQG